MKQIDMETIRDLEMPQAVLMERAALCTVEEILAGGFSLSRVIVIAGCGNNGGDGVCIARILKEKGICSEVFVLGTPSSDSECAHQIRIAQKTGVSVTEGSEEDCIVYLGSSAPSLLVDAIFGVGLNRAIDEKLCELIRYLNAMECGRVSVDIPSGVNATTGAIEGEAVKSDLTVTYGAYKTGQFLYPGHTYCGQIRMHPIGIRQDYAYETEDLYALEDTDLPPVNRKPDSHKGTFGKLLLIAGSAEVGGAAVLSAKAAFHAGIGMVRVFTHQNNRDILLQAVPEAMVTTYDDELTSLPEAMQWADVIAIGPGISTSDLAGSILRTVLSGSRLPLILDADAINLIAEGRKSYGFPAEDGRELILTPHLKEFSRLTGLGVSEIKADPVSACRDFAGKNHCTCVLKDARTVISDGTTTYLNLSGNAGMATAGSGDVLLGLVAALRAQGLKPLAAAAYGAYIHGRAGDAAAKIFGQSGMTASDLTGQFKEYLQ
ncbi:MAG: NAD(P)H-hydrate dehydratase [Lachnospiraceae bacterium]|nr:NAD(P)H-hydrate dehydratase [Lachnospiraceae bacterium]